jgi:hypothetical protein
MVRFCDVALAALSAVVSAAAAAEVLLTRERARFDGKPATDGQVARRPGSLEEIPIEFG